MPQTRYEVKAKVINTLCSFLLMHNDVEKCGKPHTPTIIVENWGIYRYTKPVLLWRGKGKMDVVTSGWTCFLWNC